uniref:Variable outer membrane protein n=1 Tax=Steinernema glaseri TaxID=37863 RepID=A0A1I7YSG8_9BILA
MAIITAAVVSCRTPSKQSSPKEKKPAEPQVILIKSIDTLLTSSETPPTAKKLPPPNVPIAAKLDSDDTLRGVVSLKQEEASEA